MSGELMALTADRLIAHGLTVVQHENRESTWIEADGCGWELVVSDSGSVELVYRPQDTASRGRDWRADLAALLLTGKPRVNRQPPEDVSAMETDLAWIGFSLRGNSFDVDIHAYPDSIGLDCPTSIVVRLDKHATIDRAETVVYAEEDDSLLFCRDYAPEHVVYDPASHRAYFPDLSTVADAIVSTILPAITSESLAMT